MKILSWELVKRFIHSHKLLMDTVTNLRKVYNGHPTRGMVAMLYVGRSGSTVLADLIRQHSQMHWGGELFAYIVSNAPGFVSSTPGFKTTRSWVRSVIEYHAARKRCQYFGFETQHAHLGLHCIGMTAEEYIDFLESLGFAYFVVLTRRNLLRIVISALVVLQTRTLHVPVEVKTPNRVYVDPAMPWGAWAGSLTNIISAYQGFYAVLDEQLRDKKALKLIYEEDIEHDPSVAYEKVCEFLDISPEPFEIRRARTNPFSIAQMVTNYEEVCVALRGTPFEWMLTA